MESNHLYIGIDWGAEQHYVHVLDELGNTRLEQAIAHQPQALASFAQQLAAEFPDALLQVAIETSNGPLVETLLAHSWEIYHLNPKQLDRFRDRFSPSGAKDDRRDAKVLASSLRTDSHAFQRVVPLGPMLMELREWSRIHDELTSEQGRLSNQLREQLARYYPQLLNLKFDLDSPIFFELFELAPNPKQAQKLSLARIKKSLSRRRIRRLCVDEVHAILQGPSWELSKGTLVAAQAHATLLLPRLKLVAEQRRHAFRTIEKLLGQLVSSAEQSDSRRPHDVTVLRSLPGVGPLVLAALLTEGFQALSCQDYHTLRLRAGVAPVTLQTGRRPAGPRARGNIVVLQRRACNARLRQALYHWARVAAQRDSRVKHRYLKLRQRGKSYATSLRIIGDGLLRIACAMLRDRTLYLPSATPHENAKVA